MGFILLITAALLLDTFLPSGPRRALPESAYDIQEYYSDSGWNGDFLRVIKAKLPEKDYESYAKALGLATRYDSSKHEDIKSYIDIGAGDTPVWWDPPKASVTTYFEYTKGDGYVKTLKYSDGTVYLFIVSW